jgi:lysophospholipase L1-like esterase
MPNTKKVILCCLAALLTACSPTQHLFAQAPHWVGSWGQASSALPGTTNGETISPTTFRNLIHLSLGGTAIRVSLTNELGADSLQVGSATVAVDGGGGSLAAGTTFPLTFGGQTSVTIAAGAFAVSDPIPMVVPAFANLAVDIYLPSQQVQNWTYHRKAISTNYEASGNQAGAIDLVSSQEITSWYLLKGVDVLTTNGASVIAFGDSITDGYGSTQDANHRWPDYLAQLRAADNLSLPLSVVNEGLSGNRVLNDGTGLSALNRLNRDVLTQSGAKYVILLDGINDILQGTTTGDSGPYVTAQQIEQGYTQIAQQVHAAGLQIFGGTLTPTSTLSSTGELERAAVNHWIRYSGVFDYVIDFDMAVRDDPNYPDSLIPAYDSGDNLHPNDAGYQAMADAIHLKHFE